MPCPRSIGRCSCCTSWRDTTTSRSVSSSGSRVERPRHDCRRRARSFERRCTSSKESGPMHDDKFDEFLRRETDGYGEPVTPPAEAIWAAIERDVARAIQPGAGNAERRFVSKQPLWIGIGLALAATLVIGVAVGRWSASSTTARPVTARREVPDDSARAAAVAQASVLQYLGEAEVFLTAVRADLKSGRKDNDRTERSRQLLSRTRLLLSSREPRSPAVDLLLRDLELLLAEISALPPAGRPMDERLIDERLRHGTILPRIRTTLPAQSAGL